MAPLSRFDVIEVHPLHGLSNRACYCFLWSTSTAGILAIVSAVLVGRDLQSRVTIDWRLDSSKFVRANMHELLEARFFRSMISPVHRPRRYEPEGTFRELRCDAYYRQHDPGWHTRLMAEAPFQRGLKAYSRGGGFAGRDPGLNLVEYIRGSVPPCNETLLAAALSRERRRPHLPSIVREGCSAFFRAFEGFGSCSPTQTGPHLRLGLSLWSPLVPLNGSCVFPLLPPADKVLRQVWWLPKKTLGIHVRRGDFDKRWPRASLEQWMAAVDGALRSRGLRRLFVSSDDLEVHGFFVNEFHKLGRRDVVLPRFMDESFFPTGTRNVDFHKLWSKQGNIHSLAEQVTLATADFILGSWGSTYSTLAAAWFDKPIAYVPLEASRECASATAEHPCPWRGATTHFDQSHRHGAKCGVSLRRWVDRLRTQDVSDNSRYRTGLRQLPQLIQTGRRLQGFAVDSKHQKHGNRRRNVNAATAKTK